MAGVVAMDRAIGDEAPEGERAEGARGGVIRIFATWTRDELGPMFCRWMEPDQRTVAEEKRG